MLVHTSNAQTDDGEHPHIFMMDFKLPSPTTNRSFRNYMNGVGDFNGTYMYRMENGLCLGGGFKYMFTEVHSAAFQTTTVGKLEIFNPFLKLGKRTAIGDRVFMEYSVKSGYDFVMTSANTCPDNYIQQTFNIEPQAGIYMYSNENLAFGVTMSYNFLFFEFTPDNLCLDYFPGAVAESSMGFSQIFAVGLGFSAKITKPGERGG